ncbi:MAG: hypothetical protein HY851_05445 [candidate division Zixibacteria bacterium]|nr:hypothetical protein [candidate division Zixibacteria bacterium]
MLQTTFRPTRPELSRYAIIALMIVTIVGAGVMIHRPVQGTTRDVILHVEAPPSGWSESRLQEKLAVTLGRHADMNITLTSDIDGRMPPFPGASRDFDSLTAWGNKAGGRYLMVVRVASERFETRKTFNMPLIFQKYEVFGVLEGEIRMIDLQKPRLLAAEPFSTELRGPRVFQSSLEDDQRDPDLHLSAAEKVHFLARLEQRAADQLVAQASSLMKGR